MRRKLVQTIKRFRIYFLFIIIYVVYSILISASQPSVVERSKPATNEHIYTARNVYGSAYPVFSVVAVNTSDDVMYDVFAVNVWINETTDQNTGFCCYLMAGGAVITKKHLRINQRREMFKYTAQVECPNPDSSIKDISSHLLGITLSKTGVCTYTTTVFVRPYFPVKQNTDFSFAVCGKFIFGEINMELTIEWMEYNKYMGVNKVVLYPYNISSDVSKMLEFYRSSGFVDVIPFILPPGDEEGRHPGDKTMAAWNDEQLVVYDCQSRLRGYHYVAVLDLDEFIVPIMNNNFKNMLIHLIHLLPSMVAVEVYSEMYILDWGKTNEDGALIISQYENRTVSKVPHIDINQRKLIHLPSRVHRGSVITHGCKPIDSSFQIFKDPMSIMSINHYRGCVNYRKGCLTRKRVTDKRIVRFLKQVEIAVQETKQELKNNVTAQRWT